MGTLPLKFMGSKRAMLKNGLGEALANTVSDYERFVDLFSGSTAVACHVAENFHVPVIASDLQSFSTALSDAILSRTKPLEENWIPKWLKATQDKINTHPIFIESAQIQNSLGDTSICKLAKKGRHLFANIPLSFSKSYGGYYFSPLQAIQLETLRKNLPEDAYQSKVALAALIQTASMCSASPGHTAQPFNPTTNAGKYVTEAWSKDIMKLVAIRCKILSSRHALVKGIALNCDANTITNKIGQSDLVFLDPPYSGVHYSRFYHVLESLCRNAEVDVFGSGRYPCQSERPRSDYSMRSTSEAALEDLLSRLSKVGCGAIVTFPVGNASNGLSGNVVQKMAERYFTVEEAVVKGRFSTLGGNLKNRSARVVSRELLLTLTPLKQSLIAQ